MTDQFLNKTGLARFWAKIKEYHISNTDVHISAQERTKWNNKVDSIPGKGLSTNDYTNEEKIKLANAPTTEDVTALSNEDDLLQAQIDQLVAPTGEAPSAAEVENARVGADATVYPTLGEAVRGQVSELKSALSDMIDVFIGENKTDPALTYGATINNSTGAITAPDSYYRCSAKIPCEYGETLYIVSSNAQGVASIRKTNNDKVAFYQADDTFLSIGYNADSYPVPQNTAYCVQQGYNAQMRDGMVGIFKKPLSQLGTQWIPYQETKRLKYSYTPEIVSEEGEKLKAYNTAPGENLLDWSKIVFTQEGLSAANLQSNFFPLEENTTYTLKYDGAVDQAIMCYVRFYSENSDSYIGQARFSFKVGEFTFTTVANTVKAEIYVYKNGGITPETFPMANGTIVYGSTAPLTTLPYKEEISADSIPVLPSRVYTNRFGPIQTMAHMGQSFYFPQNTKWSWLGAKKAGFDFIECDLQVTSDDVIVLIHDPDMRRYGGTEQQTVSSLTLAELQEFDAGEWFNKRYSGTQFPVFDDFVGFAKALGMKLALDCKGIDTTARVDAVANILRKWGMENEVIWIISYSLINYVWSIFPNAKIMWATSGTLVNGAFEDTPGGWFSGMTGQWDDSKKQTKTITININGTPTQITASVPADGVWFGITQNYVVADNYGLSDLQLTGQYAKAFGVHYGLYAIDSDDDLFNYVTSIPELEFLTSNRTTVQAATCKKFGVGVSDRPQNIGEDAL